MDRNDGQGTKMVDSLDLPDRSAASELERMKRSASPDLVQVDRQHLDKLHQADAAWADLVAAVADASGIDPDELDDPESLIELVADAVEAHHA